MAASKGPTGLRAKLARHARISTLVAAVVVGSALAVGAWFLFSSPPTYPLSARFSSAQGVLPGTTVSVLGVKVGSVTAVRYEGGSVLVTMEVSSSQALPANADAQLVSPELLGEPDIELSPGYSGGARLSSGATIPESRTAVPVTTDELLAQMKRVLGAIQPTSARQLVEALAADLQGQGQTINDLLGNASSTVSLLASKGNDLGRLDGELAALTGTLRSHESQLAQLITDYDTVSAVIAGHQQQLGAALSALADASKQLAGLLTPNLHPIEQDVAVITTVGRTLDRNLSSLDEAIISSASLFAAAHRAYDPVKQWLDLNNQAAPGLTAPLLEGLVRDRLAGVCRRILAHHSAGLSAQDLKTLAECGNPSSGYFDPVLTVIQRVLAGLPAAGGTPGASSPQTAIGQAIATIPGLTPAERTQVSKTISNPTSSAKHKKKKKKKAASTSIDQTLDKILGPLPPLPGTGGGASGTGNTGGGLLGSVSGGAFAWSSFFSFLGVR